MSLTLNAREMLLPHDHAYFEQCHASTLVTLSDGVPLVGYFAGMKEGSGDTAIWLSRRTAQGWEAPQRVIAEPGLAHWNPVLHQHAGRLGLFYKVGPDVHHWATRVTVSDDEGVTWSRPVALVGQDPLPRGPVKNKLLVMSNGEWLAPGSIEDDRHWDAFVDISADNGQNWQSHNVPLLHITPAAGEQDQLWQGLQQNALWETELHRVFQWDGVIQPTAWESAPGKIHLLMRSTRGFLYRSDSDDYGRHWSQAYATTVPNNNSGIDVVRLSDGTLVLACNPIGNNWGQRTPLSLLVSYDNGAHWETEQVIEHEDGEFSYPALIVNDNQLCLTYTWNRKNIVYCALTWRAS